MQPPAFQLFNNNFIFVFTQKRNKPACGRQESQDGFKKHKKIYGNNRHR
ncbi:hypothetical protein [Joostella sp. CR20]